MSKRILVAEDDLDIARLVQFQLQFNGYAVTMAPDGAEALKLARKEPPDVILVDWMMPVMDGLQTVKALKADPQLAHIPVILMTARAQGHDMQAGLAAGAAAYLVKPFPLEQLIATLGEVLP
ncbi:MAG TPA: response regulator [Symbiobacteriaceae bacterium]|jgi:CheY-like chemotaxis protein|nr:response regulator [Symbiobacteriaceae bacterium]